MEIKLSTKSSCWAALAVVAFTGGKNPLSGQFTFLRAHIGRNLSGSISYDTSLKFKLITLIDFKITP